MHPGVWTSVIEHVSGAQPKCLKLGQHEQIIPGFSSAACLFNQKHSRLRIRVNVQVEADLAAANSKFLQLHGPTGGAELDLYGRAALLRVPHSPSRGSTSRAESEKEDRTASSNTGRIRYTSQIYIVHVVSSIVSAMYAPKAVIGTECNEYGLLICVWVFSMALLAHLFADILESSSGSSLLAYRSQTCGRCCP